MRAVVQRVSRAAVTAHGSELASIGRGMVVLLGIRAGDTETEAEQLARKLLGLRIFEGADGRMNLSVTDVGGEILCISNFTVYGDTRRGNRPSFTDAARPEEAGPLYEKVLQMLGAKGGSFGARMAVELVNDGPVTILMDT
ncbi:MAG TPA: D-aminoacyl-tRNA deacylase [Thermoleophilaceae bacterium]|nr:D-aminoacyl-tRNA deacylase [Thermoleophilaceae bacterium]